MRRPLIRLVDDVALVRNLEIDKFQDKKDHEDDSVSYVSIHIFYAFIDSATLLRLSSKLTS